MKAVTVTTASTSVFAGGNTPFIHIKHNGTNDVFLLYDGDATTVTTAIGIPLAAGESLMLNNDGGGKNPFINPITAIVASGTENLRVQGDINA